MSHEQLTLDSSLTVTPDQFEALADLARVGSRDKNSASYRAAQLVYVEGLKESEAARAVAVSDTAVQKVCRKISHAMELINVYNTGEAPRMSA
ncbi:MAG: hypothetical protein CMB99_16240 [Flavobacteriaceae bacterium]|nr:hypothetical protein [Flavobacteriaceae bacterium]